MLIREIDLATGAETQREPTAEERATFAAMATEAAQAAPPEPTPSPEQWRALLKATGKTDAEIDALFALAATI